MITASSARPRHKKFRAGRLAKEIALLESMDYRLWLKVIGCAASWFLAILLGGVIFSEFVVKAVYPDLTHATTVVIGLVIGAAAYLIWRYPVVTGGLLIYLLIVLSIAVIFEDIVLDVPIDGSLPSEPERMAGNRKSRLQARIKRAIEKRKSLLAKL
jgi:hypothetical protein